MVVIVDDVNDNAPQFISEDADNKVSQSDKPLFVFKIPETKHKETSLQVKIVLI